MPRPDESDPPRTDPVPSAAPSDGAERTPNAVGTAVSATRPVTPIPTPGSDTLLSVPPATRADLALDERLAAVERTVDDLSRRIAELSERKRVDPAPGGPFPWFWLVFLAGLALAWQIVAHLR